MSKRLFQKVGEDGEWRDVGNPPILEMLTDLTPEDVVIVMGRLGNIRSGEEIHYELREVPDNTEATRGSGESVETTR